MVALPFSGSREIIMRKLTVTAAVAALAVSLASLVMVSGNPASTGGPHASISPHEMTLAAPAMAAGPAPDAF